MPDPNDLSSYEFQENPYLSMIRGGQSGAPQGGQMGGQMMGGQQPSQPGQGAPQGGQMMGPAGKKMEMPEDQMSWGETGDSSRELVSAINSLENFIKKSTERDTIGTARSIIMLLTRLMAKDQEINTSKLGGQ